MMCECLWYYRYPDPDIPSKKSNLISNFDAWKLHSDFGLSKKWKIGPESEEGSQDYKPLAREYDGSGGDHFFREQLELRVSIFWGHTSRTHWYPGIWSNFPQMSFIWTSGYWKNETFWCFAGWWFQLLFIFIPKFGEMIQFDYFAYFSDGWFRVFSFIYGCFQTIWVPENGWFIMENLIKMDDLGGKHTIFGNTYICKTCRLLVAGWLFLSKAPINRRALWRSEKCSAECHVINVIWLYMITPPKTNMEPENDGF